jgi:hypothetical protein
MDYKSQSSSLMSLIRYVETAPRKREVIEFSSQSDADRAGHQIRRLGGERVKVSIGTARVVVSVS